MGDPKTLTPGRWTPLRARSMDYLTDRSTDPFYAPPPPPPPPPPKKQEKWGDCGKNENEGGGWNPGRITLFPPPPPLLRTTPKSRRNVEICEIMDSDEVS